MRNCFIVVDANFPKAVLCKMEQ